MSVMEIALTVVVVVGFLVSVRGFYHLGATYLWTSDACLEDHIPVLRSSSEPDAKAFHKVYRRSSSTLVAPLRPKVQTSAFTLATATCTVSIVLLLFSGRLIRVFYPTDSEDDDRKDFINEGVAGFLSVVGLLYALLVAHLLSQAHDRVTAFQASFAEELAAVHAAYMTADEKETVLYRAYVNQLQDEIHARQVTDVTTALPITTAPRDLLHTALACRYKRSALRHSDLGWLVYLLNVLLCTGMFFGVLLIESGSDALNMIFCFCCIALIGLTTFIVADLDQPFTGTFRVAAIDAHLLLTVIDRDIANSALTREDSFPDVVHDDDDDDKRDDHDGPPHWLNPPQSTGCRPSSHAAFEGVSGHPPEPPSDIT